MLLSTNLTQYEYCLTKKTINLIRDANKGCIDQAELGSTILLNNQFTAMLQFEPVGTELTAGYTSIATLDFTSFSAFGDLLGNVVVAGVVIASFPEANYPDIDSLLDAIALAINTNSTLYTATNVGSGVFTIEVVTPGTALNDTEVSVEINPTFFATEQLVSGNAGNITIVNNPSHSLYGKLVFGGLASNTFTSAYIRIFDNGTEIGSSPIYPSQSQYAAPPLGYLYSISTPITAYSETDEKFMITGRTYGSYTLMDQNFLLLTNPAYPTSPFLYYGFVTYNPFANCVWNPVNNRFYFTQGAASGFPNSLRYLVSGNTFTAAQNGTLTGADALTVNSANGDIWVCGSQSVYVVDTSGAIATTIVGTAGHVPLSVTYCADLDTMYVAYRVTASPTTSYVREFDATTYSILTSTFYTINAGVNSTAVFYSAIFNVLFINTFVGAVLHTDVVSMSGTLKDSIPITSKDINQSFADDVKNNKVWSISSDTTFVSETPIVLRYFELGIVGEETIEAAFYGGVDPTYSDGEGNCISQTQVNVGIQVLNKNCIGCVSDIEPQVIPPSLPNYTIYYGKSTLTTLTNTQVEALGSVTASSYIGTYNYVAGALTYVFFAFPSLLGTPSRFKDLLGGLDVIMTTPFSVTINSVAYTVYRSYYTLSSTQSMEVQG